MPGDEALAEASEIGLSLWGGERLVNWSLAEKIRQHQEARPGFHEWTHLQEQGTTFSHFFPLWVFWVKPYSTGSTFLCGRGFFFHLANSNWEANARGLGFLPLGPGHKASLPWKKKGGGLAVESRHWQACLRWWYPIFSCWLSFCMASSVTFMWHNVSYVDRPRVCPQLLGCALPINSGNARQRPGSQCHPILQVSVFGDPAVFDVSTWNIYLTAGITFTTLLKLTCECVNLSSKAFQKYL